MHYQWIPAVLTSTFLLFGTAAFAAEEVKPAPKSATAAPAKSTPSKASPQTKKPKLVEINSATAAQLKTVPGIGDAEAEKIIKNRPYPTRAHLVTKEALTYDQYLAVKDLFTVVAPDPKKLKK
ncbi:MAG: hypothetical protein H6Q33_5428 [Deltaproteobacteria bacterium]|nr:hypothetical protein [Deltaproteobacteria bacterium]